MALQSGSRREEDHDRFAGQVRHGLVREERGLEGARREPLQAADQEDWRGEGDGDAPEVRRGLQGELPAHQEARRDDVIRGLATKQSAAVLSPQHFVLWYN